VGEKVKQKRKKRGLGYARWVKAQVKQDSVEKRKGTDHQAKGMFRALSYLVVTEKKRSGKKKKGEGGPPEICKPFPRLGGGGKSAQKPSRQDRGRGLKQGGDRGKRRRGLPLKSTAEKNGPCTIGGGEIWRERGKTMIKKRVLELPFIDLQKKKKTIYRPVTEERGGEHGKGKKGGGI